MENIRVVTLIYQGDTIISQSETVLAPIRLAFPELTKSTPGIPSGVNLVSEEPRPKRTNSLKGRHISEEHRRKIAEANRRRRKIRP